MTRENHRERHTLNDLTETEISVVENFEREVAEAKLEKYTPNNGYNQWAIHPGGKFSPTMPTKKKIDPGFYEVGNDSNVGFYLQKKKNYDR